MRKCLVAACVAITVALSPVAVLAGPFGRKASQVDVPKLIVERPLTLGRSVMELSLGVGYRSVDSHFDSYSEIERSVKTISIATKDLLRIQPEEVTTTYTILDIGVNFGLTNNLTLGFNIPFYFAGQTIDNFDAILTAENYPLLRDSLENQEPSATNMGDSELWAIYQLWGQAAPLSSLALKIQLKTASGNDSFGDVSSETEWNEERGEWYPDGTVEDIRDTRTVMSGTGQVDLFLALMFKQQFGPVAGTIEAGYNARFEDRVMYIPYLLGNTIGFAGKIDPGDEVKANLELMVQPIEYVAIGFDLRFLWRGRTRAAWPKLYPAAVDDSGNPVGLPNDVFVGDHYRDTMIAEFAKDDRGGYVLDWTEGGKLGQPKVDRYHSSEAYLLTLKPKLLFFITEHLDITLAADLHLVGKNMGNLTNYQMGEYRDAPSIISNEQVMFPNDALGTGAGGIIIGAISGTATVRF